MHSTMLYFTILYFTVLYCTVLQTRFRDLPNSCVCVSTVYSPPPQPDKLRFVKSLWKSPHTAQHTVSTVSGNVCIYWTLAATGTLVGRTVRRQTRQKMTHTLPWSWHFFMNQTWAELFLFSPFVLIIWRKPWGYIWNVKRCMYSVTFIFFCDCKHIEMIITLFAGQNLQLTIIPSRWSSFWSGDTQWSDRLVRQPGTGLGRYHNDISNIINFIDLKITYLDHISIKYQIEERLRHQLKRINTW